MKKIILLVSFAFISGVSYLLYSHFFKNENKEVWDFVPNNALAVYDIQNATEVYNSFKETGFGQGIKKLDLWNEVRKAFSPSDTSKYNDQFIENLKSIQLLISVHAVAKERTDLIYFINTSQNSNGLIQEYINELINETSSALNRREYNGRNIFEIEGDEFECSYFIEDGVIIISQTSFLIEDVIRTISLPKEGAYKMSHAKSLRANKLKNDHGDLYINTERLNVFLKTFTSQLDIEKIASSTFMDVKVTDNLMSLSGFTYSGKNDYLNVMKDQKAAKISISSYIPNTTYSVFHTGISDASLWYDNYKKQLGLKSLLDKWDTERMAQWMGKELVLINLNTQHGEVQGKLLFIDTQDVNDALNELNTLAEDVAVQSQDTVFYENYGGVLIKELNLPEFPEKLFGDIYEGFLVSYYAIIDNYVVLSNGIESMHTLINSIEQENTWGRTLDKSQWLSHTLEEASLSYFFDYTQSVTPLKNTLNDTWKKHLESNGEVMKGFGMGAIQFSNIDGQFYTNMILQYDLEKTKPISLNFDTESTTYLEHITITKPFVVQNHNKPQVREVIVQDSVNNIYLIDNKGAIIWQDSIGQELNSNIYQIDYYKNKKLQYLFAAGQIIYLLDRNGNHVEDFPLDVGFEITQLSVMDYDHTKNYRILAAEKNGNLHMYDKEKNNLEGWTPRKMEESLLTMPRHVRVRGKDAIIVTQSDGKIYVLNRKGEVYKGFPIVLENGMSGDLHIDVGRDFEHTIFSLISGEGGLVQFNMNGDIVNKRQFYKPTKDTFFELVTGVTENDFVIMRQNAFRISLLDTFEKVIINKDYLNNDKRTLQYYDFGGDNNVYVVNNFVQGFGYIYNHAGKLLNNVPINNEHEIALLKNTRKNKIFIYSAYQDQINVYSY